MRPLVAVLALLVASVVSAAELHVPQQFATIQAAIAASVDGDTVLVAPGTYYEPVDLMGRIITLKSTGGAGVTILDGSRHDGSILKAVFGEKRGTVVQGFTFRNGEGEVGTPCGFPPNRYGAAILIRSSGLSIVDCIFENNGAIPHEGQLDGVKAGGAVFSCQSDLFVGSSRFENNKATEGGAVYVAASRFVAEIEECTFERNEGAHGGAIGTKLVGTATFAVTHSHFKGNHASHGAGILVSGEQRPTATITDCDFTDGSGSFGAGINILALDETSVEVLRSDFTRNEAGFGGGVFASSTANSRVRITNSRFFDNTAHACCNTGFYYDNCFIDGAAPGNGLYYGGGVDVRTSGGGGSIALTNCLFAGNSGDRGGGAHASSCSGGTIQFSNNTVVGNTGGGIQLRNGVPRVEEPFAPTQLRISNSIVRQNGGGEQIAIEGAASVTFSDVQGGFSGEGNFDVVPSFVNAALRDFRLADGSACIDAGDNAAIESSVTTDLQRRTRFADDPKTHDRGAGHAPIVDVGAYEFQPQPVRRRAARH
ncbi:MAG TPA: right-handed parallel beta-helix repeat-containing protein [Thermoanaerobaculia bacterium]|nr:right-handed parallel beta-helix repeat-containing protein [Thermoanaerobaculia bacterium]